MTKNKFPWGKIKAEVRKENNPQKNGGSKRNKGLLPKETLRKPEDIPHKTQWAIRELLKR